MPKNSGTAKMSGSEQAESPQKNKIRSSSTGRKQALYKAPASGFMPFSSRVTVSTVPRKVSCAAPKMPNRRQPIRNPKSSSDKNSKRRR